MDKPNNTMKTAEPINTPHLGDYYLVLKKHKAVIFACVLIAVTLTLFVNLLKKPLFRSSCTLVIEKEESTSPLTGERTSYDSYISQSLTFNTHFKLITSRPVLENVVKKLNLHQHDDRDRLKAGTWNSAWKKIGRNLRMISGKKTVASSRDRITAMVDVLKEKIRIAPVNDTRLLKLSVVGTRPELVQKITDTLAGEYILFNINNRLKASQNTLGWMTDQLYSMKKKLEDAETAFLAYKRKEKLFSISGRQKVISRKIEDFNDAYIKARNKRLELEAKIEELTGLSKHGAEIVQVRSLIENPLVDELYKDLLAAEVELSRLGKVYKSKHPKTIQTKTQIRRIREKLNEALIKEIDSLIAEKSVLLAREQVIQKTISDFENEALENNKKELAYTIFERSVETNRKLYDTLLSKVKESSVVSNVDMSNIRVAEAAQLPKHPFKPNKTLNFFLSIVIGLLTGVGLAFLLEYFDRSLRTEEDVRRFTNLPVLSVVPLAASQNKNGKPPLNTDGYPFLPDFTAESHFAEAFRCLRTNIHFSTNGTALRSILITSACPGEGKTSTVFNLACVLSQSGRSVLMVDADLRKSKLSKLLSALEKPGITGLISDLLHIDLTSGSLADYGVNDLVKLILLQRKTGVLIISDQDDTIELCFFKGKLVDVNWLTRPEEKKLANTLVREKLITRELADLGLSRQNESKQKLGHLLVGMGVLSADSIKPLLSVHMLEGLRTARQIKTGEFVFKETPEMEPRKTDFNPVDIDTLYQELAAIDEGYPFIQEKIDACVMHTKIENLYLLPTGGSDDTDRNKGLAANPFDPTESRGLSFLINRLKKRFDFLIIDSPPVLPVNDTLHLVDYSDGTALIVKSGHVNRMEIKKAIEQLRGVNSDLIGIVLNQVNLKKEGYYKYYREYRSG